MNLDLNKIIKSANNVEYDYSSNVNGIPSIENGDYLVAPVFKVEPINSYKQVENPYNIAKYSIELNFFKGPNKLNYVRFRKRRCRLSKKMMFQKLEKRSWKNRMRRKYDEFVTSGPVS